MSFCHGLPAHGHSWHMKPAEWCWYIFHCLLTFIGLLEEEAASHVDVVCWIRSRQPIVFWSCLHERLDDILKFLSGEQPVFQADLTSFIEVWRIVVPLPPASLSEHGENDFQKRGRKTADVTHLPSSLTSEKRGNSFFWKMGKYYLLFTGSLWYQLGCANGT